MDVAQSVQGIGFVLGVDVGDGHVIEDHLHGAVHSAGGNVQVLVIRSVGVDKGDEATDREDHDDAQGDEVFFMARNAEGVQSTLRAGPRRQRTTRRRLGVAPLSVWTSPTYMPVDRPLRLTVSRPTPRCVRTSCPSRVRTVRVHRSPSPERSRTLRPDSGRTRCRTDQPFPPQKRWRKRPRHRRSPPARTAPPD